MNRFFVHHQNFVRPVGGYANTILAERLTQMGVCEDNSLQIHYRGENRLVYEIDAKILEEVLSAHRRGELNVEFYRRSRLTEEVTQVDKSFYSSNKRTARGLLAGLRRRRGERMKSRGRLATAT